MKSSIHIVASLRSRFNNKNKKFKGLTNISSKDSLVLLKIKPSLKFSVFKSQLLPISWTFQTWDFHLAERTLPVKSPLNGPFPSGKCSTMKLEPLENNGNLWTYVYCG